MNNPRALLTAYAGQENPRAMPPFQLLEAAAPKAFAALWAVLDLHVPDPAVMARVVCKHCVAVLYPCPTVKAIIAALEAQ